MTEPPNTEARNALERLYVNVRSEYPFSVRDMEIVRDALSSAPGVDSVPDKRGDVPEGNDGVPGAVPPNTATCDREGCSNAATGHDAWGEWCDEHNGGLVESPNTEALLATVREGIGWNDRVSLAALDAIASELKRVRGQRDSWKRAGEIVQADRDARLDRAVEALREIAEMLENEHQPEPMLGIARTALAEIEESV